MELKNETNQFVATTRQLSVIQMRNRRRADLDRAAIRFVEQAENVKKRALAAAGRTDHRVQASGFDIERDAAQRVDPLLLFTEVTLDVAATERDVAFHKLEPRKVSTGCSWAARFAGT